MLLFEFASLVFFPIYRKISKQKVSLYSQPSLKFMLVSWSLALNQWNPGEELDVFLRVHRQIN